MAEPIPPTKPQIRRQARAARRLLADRDDRSRRIAERLRTLPEYRSAQTILLYVGTRDEVQTDDLIAEALATAKTAIVPYCRDGELQLFHLQHLDELAPGAYGIPEPRHELRQLAQRHVLPEQLDVILVPGIAFDVDGARCGHGQGYYDKLLQTVKRKTARLALAFDCQIFPKIPTESHDVDMDKIVTESTIYPEPPSAERKD